MGSMTGQTESSMSTVRFTFAGSTSAKDDPLPQSSFAMSILTSFSPCDEPLTTGRTSSIVCQIPDYPDYRTSHESTRLWVSPRAVPPGWRVIPLTPYPLR